MHRSCRGFFFFLFVAAMIVLPLKGGGLRVVRSAAEGKIKSLDPVQADELASRNILGAVYDTLLEYDYDARPYRLKPAMLAEMPTSDRENRVYRFRLRDDLFFAEDPVFPDKASRRIGTDDVFYSLKRIVDSRNHSPLYWMLRNKICGMEAFRNATVKAGRNDDSVYDMPVEGLVKINDLEFEIRLQRSDPRFLYMLAMPNAAVVSRRGVRHYGEEIARHPVGSGPFRLKEWRNNYKVILERNPDYREEYYAAADSSADRKRRLPLADRIEIWQVRQPTAAWMLFLQGAVDINALDKDNIDIAAVGGELTPALVRRGVRLLKNPEFEIRYIGFNFKDPILGGNLKLRQALSLAYDVRRRVEFSNHQLIPAHGPIPPGVAGFDAEYRNPFARLDLPEARKLLAAAGYPGGLDPATGKALRLTFDQTGNSAVYRQLGELASADFAEIGLDVEAVMNNKPRFFEKLRLGSLQMFRLSWIGDYPDAENFLQLFYSGNIGGCNRTGFSDPEFDRCFEAVMTMADSPERTRLYREMVRYLAEKCVWIYEGFPIAGRLCHGWLENYRLHDFAFSRWKYLTVDPAVREQVRSGFTPLSLEELAGGQETAEKPHQK